MVEGGGRRVRYTGEGGSEIRYQILAEMLIGILVEMLRQEMMKGDLKYLSEIKQS